MMDSIKYKSYTNHNYKKISQIISFLSEEELFVIDVVSSVLPFKVDNYVIDELIDWDNYKTDPIFILTFPQKEMLETEHYNIMAELFRNGADKNEIKEASNKIRHELNPAPAGQADNVPEVNGIKLPGVQHKYRETMLFFPQQGQTCHAYCTFCFRWPQFTQMDEAKFAMKEIESVIEYLKQHTEITDFLFTGGDPMVMKTKVFKAYIDAILEADIPHLKTIRIGTKSLAYWPYRYTHDDDAEDLIDLIKKVIDNGIHVSFMAHFNHYAELKTDAVKKAIKVIQSTGAIIRTQSPVMRNINADADIWARMWREQVDLGLIPYYMFLARDTGAQHYFSVPLVEAWDIFREAYKKVSGIVRTVKGPSMSSNPGKIQVLGVVEIKGEKYLTLEFVQGRNPDWVGKPFFAKYDDKAIWIDELQPALGEEEFFFEEYLNRDFGDVDELLNEIEFDTEETEEETVNILSSNNTKNIK
ncbi:MAG: 4Fe-4S cluster-binding domain-containing protein [Ichthyobacteriaceae bacterium]|nr:4Fe-4S cluster-binding domain-containing protein [Ichthyobacteriaceae bacterium]